MARLVSGSEIEVEVEDLGWIGEEERGVGLITQSWP